MFKEMRRKEKLLSREDSIEILNKGAYGMLSTVGTNGYPYVVPLNYVYHKGSIYFHTAAAEGHLLENLRHCNRVSFCAAVEVRIVPEKFDALYKSVIVFGKAEEVFDMEKEEALLALVEKYSKQHMTQGEKYIQAAKHRTRVNKIEIEHMTGKEGK